MSEVVFSDLNILQKNFYSFEGLMPFSISCLFVAAKLNLKHGTGVCDGLKKLPGTNKMSFFRHSTYRLSELYPSGKQIQKLSPPAGGTNLISSGKYCFRD